MTIPNFTPEEMQSRSLAVSEYGNGRKQGLIMWLLWLFLGPLGGHRFYLGDTKRGVLMLIAGLCFWIPGLIWALIDAFGINARLREVNQSNWVEVASRYGTPIEPMPEGAR